MGPTFALALSRAWNFQNNLSVVYFCLPGLYNCHRGLIGLRLTKVDKREEERRKIHAMLSFHSHSFRNANLLAVTTRRDMLQYQQILITNMISEIDASVIPNNLANRSVSLRLSGGALKREIFWLEKMIFQCSKAEVLLGCASSFQ